MRLDLDFGAVTPAKIQELLSRLTRLGVAGRDIEESFSRGSGPGGQKRNKTSNCVQLHYAPLDIRVRCQRERSLSVNRFLALRLLADQIERRLRLGP